MKIIQNAPWTSLASGLIGMGAAGLVASIWMAGMQGRLDWQLTVLREKVSQDSAAYAVARDSVRVATAARIDAEAGAAAAQRRAAVERRRADSLSRLNHLLNDSTVITRGDTVAIPATVGAELAQLRSTIDRYEFALGADTVVIAALKLETLQLSESLRKADKLITDQRRENDLLRQARLRWWQRVARGALVGSGAAGCAALGAVVGGVGGAAAGAAACATGLVISLP